MRAVVIQKHGDLDSLELRDLPSPSIGSHDVLVEIRATGINHLDLWVRRGVPGAKFPLPIIPGSDAAGVVRDIGSAVTGVERGQAVVVAPAVSCGHCLSCVAGRDNRCRSYRILGESRDGCCAELVAVPEACVVPKPDNLPFELAAAVGIPFLTAWHMLVDRVQLRPGETVLVQAGGSGVGIAAIQIARLWHATVIATVGSATKAQRARQLGAHHVLDYSREDVLQSVRDITHGQGVDVVVEHVGAATWDTSLRVLAWHGRLVTCGATTGADVSLNLRHLFFKSLSVLGSSMGSQAEFREVLGHVGAGRLQPVLDHVLRLDQVREAHRLLEERQVFGKVVLTP